MSRFLITGVGGDVAQSMCRVIRGSFSDAVIVGCDVSDKNAGPLFVDSFQLVPPAFSNSYIKSVKELIKDHEIKFILRYILIFVSRSLNYNSWQEGD